MRGKVHKKKRVLHILKSNIYSGAENVVITLIKDLQDEYECLYVSPKGSIGEICKAQGIAYKQLKDLKISTIKHIIQQYKPDLIHAHDFSATVKVCLTRTQVPILSHLHNNPPWIGKFHLYTFLYTLASTRCKRVLGVSQAILEEFKFKKVLKDKWTMILNPFDKDKVSSLATQNDCIEDIDCQYIDIIFVGRFTIAKDPLRFIRIVEEVKQVIPNLKVIMVGDGELRDICEQYIEERGLKEHIQCVGFKSNPYPLMQKARLLIMPSKWEGYGLVAVEAMALETPVLACAVGGLTQILTFESGLLCETDADFISKAIHLLQDENDREKVVQQGLERVSQLMDKNKYTNQIRKIYAESMNEDKILYIGMDAYLGGIETFCMNHHRGLMNKGILIDFIKYKEKIYFEQEILQRGSRVHFITERRKSPFKFYRELCKFFREHPEYKIIHMHLNTCSCIEPALIAKCYGRKVIIHSHNEWKEKNKLVRLRHDIGKALLPLCADKYLACSEKAGRWMFGNRAFIHINNAIDIHKFRFNQEVREDYRKRLQLENKFVIGHIGRLEYQKNHEFLLDIFKAVHDTQLDAVLLLIGEGSLRTKIEEKVLSLGLQDSVFLLGIREDIPEILQAMDVFVLPSHYEGLGIVGIEAQVAGLPCIVADTVPQEIALTQCVSFMSLEVPAESWASVILKYRRYDRVDQSIEVRAKGYHIQDNIETLEKIYRELGER